MHILNFLHILKTTLCCPLLGEIGSVKMSMKRDLRAASARMVQLARTSYVTVCTHKTRL